jgi:TPR repeat protein
MSSAALREETLCADGPDTNPGHGDSLFDLGLMYCLGRSVPKDLVLAHKWFNLAALRGCEAARQYRSDVAREMSTTDIAEAQKQARAWLHNNRS